MFEKLGVVIGIIIGLFWSTYASGNEIDNLIIAGGIFLSVTGFMAFGKIIDDSIKKS